MGLLVGVPVLIDRRLDVCVPELLLNEVDGLARAQPKSRRGVAQVVEADAG
jgi:hypothetical protein